MIFPPPLPAAREPCRPGTYLMWFDDSPKATPAQRVADALAAFRARYGLPASVALVHPDDLPALAGIPAGVAVRGALYITRHVAWVGIEEA